MFQSSTKYVCVWLKHVYLLPFFNSITQRDALYKNCKGYCCTWPYSMTQTLSRAPLDEGSVCRVDLYLTTYNIHKWDSRARRRDSNPKPQQASCRGPTLETAWLPRSAVSYRSVFRRVYKIAKNDYLFRRVCPFACNNSAPTGGIFMKFGIWAFLKNLSGKFKFHWNRTK
jgi:hypothetical protein